MAKDKRRIIVDAALELFAKRGFERVSIRDIAKESGFLPGSVHHFFPGKRALYEAVVAQALADSTALLLRATQTGRTAEQRLRHLITTLYALFTSDSSNIRIIDREHLEGRSGIYPRLAREFFREMHDTLRPVICDISRRKLSEREADWITSQIFSLVYGAAKLDPMHTPLLKLSTPRKAKAFVKDLCDFAVRATHR